MKILAVDLDGTLIEGDTFYDTAKQLLINGTYLYVFDSKSDAGQLIKMDQNIASKMDLFLKVKDLH